MSVAWNMVALLFCSSTVCCFNLLMIPPACVILFACLLFVSLSCCTEDLAFFCLASFSCLCLFFLAPDFWLCQWLNAASSTLHLDPVVVFDLAFAFGSLHLDICLFGFWLACFVFFHGCSALTIHNIWQLSSRSSGIRTSNQNHH